jgi:hypothetical protein
VLRGSVVTRLLREADEFDLHVVSFLDQENRA